MRSALLGSPARGVVCLEAARGWGQRPVSRTPGRFAAPCPAIAPARVGPAAPVTGRIMWDSPHGNSIARGGQNLVRPHRYAVSPTKCYPKCSGPDVRPLRSSLP